MLEHMHSSKQWLPVMGTTQKSSGLRTTLQQLRLYDKEQNLVSVSKTEIQKLANWVETRRLHLLSEKNGSHPKVEGITRLKYKISVLVAGY